MENKKKEEIGQGTAMTKEDFAALWKTIRLKVTDTYEVPPEILWVNVNPAKRKAMVAKNEKRFLKQKRNVLQKSESLSFRSDYPVKIQASFKRLLKAV